MTGLSADLHCFEQWIKANEKSLVQITLFWKNEIESIFFVFTLMMVCFFLFAKRIFSKIIFSEMRSGSGKRLYCRDGKNDSPDKNYGAQKFWEPTRIFPWFFPCNFCQPYLSDAPWARNEAWAKKPSGEPRTLFMVYWVAFFFQSCGQWLRGEFEPKILKNYR